MHFDSTTVDAWILIQGVDVTRAAVGRCVCVIVHSCLEPDTMGHKSADGPSSAQLGRHPQMVLCCRQCAFVRHIIHLLYASTVCVLASLAVVSR
jgi:hypothetical protein